MWRTSGASRSGMREDQRAGQPFHALQGQRALSFELPCAAFPPGQKLGVPVLRLGQPPFRPRHALVPVFVRLADLLVGALEQPR